jgi:hypothetical protein
MSKWKSTKLWLAVLCMSLICGGFAFVGFAADQFATFCMSLLSAAGIYSGAATAEKFVKQKPD